MADIFPPSTEPMQKGPMIHSAIECALNHFTCKRRLRVAKTIVGVIKRNLITPFEQGFKNLNNNNNTNLNNNNNSNLNNKPWQKQNKTRPKQSNNQPITPVLYQTEAPVLYENNTHEYIDLLIRYTASQECAIVEYRTATAEAVTPMCLLQLKNAATKQAQRYAHKLLQGHLPPPCKKVTIYIGLILNGIDVNNRSRVVFGLYKQGTVPP